ncbi:tetratricopeptide repeat protein [Nitrospirota bacterium]
MELDPQFAEAHNNLGNVYRAEGKLDLALKQYHLAVEVRPELMRIIILD